MGYLGNRRDRHQPSDSDLPFRPRPNYAVLSSVLAALLLAPSGAAQARTINAASPSLVDVTNAIASAVDGDTVIVPAGTAAWTSTLVLNKGITLIGQTTIDSTAGTAIDNTIIQDNEPRGAPGGQNLITVQSVAGKSYRISGFTFAPLAAGGVNNGLIRLQGNSQSVRVDHCHFAQLSTQQLCVAITDAIGVIDHNFVDIGSVGGGSFYFHNNGPGGQGDESWAAPTNFGSGQFMFIEDNYITASGSDEFRGDIDGTNGARWVFRHNHCYNIEVGNHGTEGGRYRGTRATEIYNNDFHWTVRSGHVGGSRSGALITHDNTHYGLPRTTGMTLEPFRSFFKFPSGSSPWGGASGDNPWDINDNTGHGTNDGSSNPPFLYESGTVTSGTKTSITDTSKTWPTDKWKNFTAKRLSDNQVGAITGNNNNTLFVTFYPDSGGGATWTAGDQYQIHKVLVIMDQPGRGQSDLITGSTPINTVTGTASWVHNALEPCYSWNDIDTGNNNAPVNFSGYSIGTNTVQANRDFYNGTPMPGYTPYTYPHPLVSGATPSPTPPAAPAAPKNLRIVP